MISRLAHEGWDIHQSNDLGLTPYDLAADDDKQIIGEICAEVESSKLKTELNDVQVAKSPRRRLDL
jgi:hypothetical protein